MKTTVPCSDGLEELETALRVLIRHAGRDGGYSPYYDQWQTILHGLGKLIASKLRDTAAETSASRPGCHQSPSI